MATIVYKSIKGYEYAYHVKYLGDDEQHWEYLGRTDSVVIPEGPTDMTREEAVEETRERDPGSIERISNSDFTDILDEGFKLDEGPDGVELNAWKRGSKDRVYINEWAGEDVWIDRNTGEINGIDATVMRGEDGRVIISPEGDEGEITLDTNAGGEWEEITIDDIEPGDRIRYTVDDDGLPPIRSSDWLSSKPGDGDETLHSRPPFDIESVEQEAVVSGIIPDKVSVTTADYGEFEGQGDSEVFERAVRN